MSVLNSGGNGLSINGGGANIGFMGQIAGSNLYDAAVLNTTAGVVDLTGAQFTGSGSRGILVQNTAGDVGFKNVTIANSTSTGIDVEGASGQVDFAGTTTVSGAAGVSVVVNGLQPLGVATFGNLAIDHRNDIGMLVDNSAGTVEVTGTTTITNELNSGHSAIRVSNSSAAVTFDDRVTVTNTTGDPGVSLQNNTGTTSFKALDITSNNGTALSAISGGGLVINMARRPTAAPSWRTTGRRPTSSRPASTSTC